MSHSEPNLKKESDDETSSFVQVKDDELAARLTPDYDIGCKRPTTSDDFLPTFNNKFVHLNTTPIERVTSRGIMTVDNTEHEFDAIVHTLILTSCTVPVLAPMI